MATRYGYQTLVWLKEKGWKEGSPLPDGVCGDRHVIDPASKKEMSVYEAARLQKEKTGEYPDFLKS